MKFACLVSGDGRELTDLLEALETQVVSMELDLVIADDESCEALKLAQEQGVQTMALNPLLYAQDPLLVDEIIASELLARQVDYLVLAGYSHDVHEPLALAFKHKIIRAHPSLLPAFAGSHALENVWISGVKVSGVTIHFVNEFGQVSIIAQQAFDIEEGSSLSDIESKTYPLMADLLCHSLGLIAEGRVTIKGDNTVSVQAR